jgi:hypothetical protein
MRLVKERTKVVREEHEQKIREKKLGIIKKKDKSLLDVLESKYKAINKQELIFLNKIIFFSL